MTAPAVSTGNRLSAMASFIDHLARARVSPGATWPVLLHTCILCSITFTPRPQDVEAAGPFGRTLKHIGISSPAARGATEAPYVTSAASWDLRAVVCSSANPKSTGLCR